VKSILLQIFTYVSHNKNFLFQPRGFNSIEEMCEEIVERWNDVVRPGDIVYNLGDVALNDTSAAIPYIQRLNGKQYWIRGNHDASTKIQLIRKECDNIDLISAEDTSWAYMLKYGKFNFYLSHYPTLTANFDDKKFTQHVINLHGHTHQQTHWLQLTNPFMYHVGVDSHNCTPVHIDEILSDIRNRWNELGLNTNILNEEDKYGIPQ